MKRTAVITGGAGGLGRALSAGLQTDGWCVAIIDLPSAKPSQTCPSQRFYGCDMTKFADLKETCAQICNDHASIDLIIYNAGITQIMPFESVSLSSHRKIFEINYFAAVACAQAFLQPIRKAKGTHLAISSVAGFSPLINRTSYAASKHALEGFFKSLRSEERAYGVHVAIAAPSFIATNLENPMKDAQGFARPGSAKDGIDYMSPQAAASTILNGLRKHREFMPIGKVAHLAYALNRLSPRLFQKIMERRIRNKAP